jgi:hypothetical protein
MIDIPRGKYLGKPLCNSSKDREATGRQFDRDGIC